MRAVSIVIFLGLLLLVALGALNQAELMRPSTLHLGWRSVEAPLGLWLLVLGVLSLLLALVGAALDHSQHRRAQRDTERALQVQRDLAEKAEGSRFAEVQRHLDLQAQAAQHRERDMLAQLGERLDHAQRSLQHQMDEMGNSLAAYIGEVEDRLERRHALRPLDEDYREPPYPRR